MARSLAYCFSLSLTLILLLTLMVRSVTSEECSNDLSKLSISCKQYVKYPANPKIDPSKECCDVVQQSNIKCVCGHVTKEIEKIISMEKVVYVAAKCGRPLAKGSKCGSYQIPKAVNLV
ncbi:Bifunctional inhibitor/lipid-transfer protein/seed storage 2S albumin superfamily protein [Rhynchospora pubera]|uniref:Bifunctional inhibitor/lipid-transfer protein/seed storage 2S albumin superfamily protein n=1 Tax=Rhynchospora pubera TaxID=906938 RepID=A0AAV8FWI6_9POAL|nr:Bifunctional inhibitor/lipid-transfer protein/seed storage 2S albumin superfamily protein [Rhynchospora pubera]KAJ4796149.1 Bifunctional inhibitor/lipid-transfer protein/seed storage 2S albumin superfamily protein [Rhynchospora pubera]